MAGRTAALKKQELAGGRSSAARKTAAPDRSDERPLSLGTLDGHLGYFLRRVQVWVFQDFIRTLAGIDLRPAQYSVLSVIAANRGLSQADVAQLLGIERARLVRLLDRLEKRGLTQRLASPVDRRSHALQLTPSGQALLKRARTLAQVHEANLVDKLGIATHARLIEALRDFDARR
ncbi:MAG: MarR family transcriptional regulator [Xanthobacteraceae bacterium]|nr:MarR family transcriptional regulator [Xanthobacteraceae bacterium]